MTFFKKIKDKLVDFVNFNKEESVSGEKSTMSKEKSAEIKQPASQIKEKKSGNRYYNKKNYRSDNFKDSTRARISNPEKTAQGIPNSGYRKRENVSSDNSENQKSQLQDNRNKLKKAHHGVNKKNKPGKDN